MKRLAALIAALGATAGTALGQPPGPLAGGPLDLERLAILLDLDAYQKQEVERVLTEQRDARRATRGDRTAAQERPSRDELQARRTQEREALFGKLENTLTPQQIQKLEILLDMGAGRRGPRGAPL